jgi:hypothetical protein
MSRDRVSRRTVLRGILGGIAASVALPPLECMLNSNGEAYADGTALPTVFGWGYFGNGTDGTQGNGISRWVPPTQGANFTPSPQLQPFVDAGLQTYLSVFTGCTYNGFSGTMHFSQEDACFDAATGTTLDRTIAQRWKAQPNAPVIDEVNISVVRHANGGGNYQQNSLSHGNGEYPDGIYDPQALFAQLFGMGVTNSATGLAPNAMLQTSVLDIVNADVTRLRARLGANDQKRMDAYTQNIADLQRKITTPQKLCVVPSATSIAAYIPPVNSTEVEAIDKNGDALYTLLALALACGLTRVFTIAWSTAQTDAILQAATGTTFPNGLPYGYHGTEHAQPGTPVYNWLTSTSVGAAEGWKMAQRDAVHQAVLYTMKHFASFASKLDAIPVGANSMLYQTCMWVSTDLGDGISHYDQDMPNFLIGNAGGSLKGNYHYRNTSNDTSLNNHSRVGLTALQALGFSDTSWGVNRTSGNVGNGYTNAAITDFLK